MKKETVKAMLAIAKEKGAAEIVTKEAQSNGLYSASSKRIPVFFTRYPISLYDGDDHDFLACLASVGLKLTDVLDTVEVCDGFIKVTINHLKYIKKDHARASDLHCHDSGYRDCVYRRAGAATSHYSFQWEYLDKGGEPMHTALIPFENILAIDC